MSESKFKTMRHIETVRNYLGMFVDALLLRGREHDQSKLQSPEVDIFEEFTPKLRGCTYGSPEYTQFLAEMKPALDHHYGVNRHHPEGHLNGMKDMNLIDIVEMLCDWKAATMRHADGDLRKSIEINQERFGYSDDLKRILHNTADVMEAIPIYHKAEES